MNARPPGLVRAALEAAEPEDVVPVLPPELAGIGRDDLTPLARGTTLVVHGPACPDVGLAGGACACPVLGVEAHGDDAAAHATVRLEWNQGRSWLRPGMNDVAVRIVVYRRAALLLEALRAAGVAHTLLGLELRLARPALGRAPELEALRRALSEAEAAAAEPGGAPVSWSALFAHLPADEEHLAMSLAWRVPLAALASPGDDLLAVHVAALEATALLYRAGCERAELEPTAAGAPPMLLWRYAETPGAAGSRAIDPVKGQWKSVVGLGAAATRATGLNPGGDPLARRRFLTDAVARGVVWPGEAGRG
jgi:hypothetical protein